MALTSTVLRRIGVRGSALGGSRINIVQFILDTDYPDGGYPVTAALAGFDNGVVAVIPMGLAHATPTTSADTAYLVSFDASEKKLQVFDSGGGAATNPPGEVADGENAITNLVVDCLCIGY